MKIHIFANTSCIYRNLDCSKLIKYFSLNHCTVIEDLESADIVIFISCAFREDLEERCWHIIRNLTNSNKQFIVGGCLPEISPVKFQSDYKGSFITTKSIEKIDDFFPQFAIKFSEVEDSNFFPKTHDSNNNSNLVTSHNFTKRNLRNKTDESEAYLRISRGCLGSCTYCAIKWAIGKHESKPLQILLNEYTRLINDGYKDICISGDDTGAYGKDINLQFKGLLDALFEISPKADVKWVIEDLYPRWLMEYSKTIIKYAAKIRVIQAVIQSGNERILELMYRKIDLAEYIKIFKEIKNLNAEIIIEAQIIIGFPSETFNEFLETLNIIKEINCEFVFISGYSDRENTHSSLMDGKITDKEIDRRIQIAKDFFNTNNVKWSCHK
jgi:MiaB/RimO family radical SAM methylthiotransferase